MLAELGEYIQRELRRRGLREVSAVEAAHWIERAGLLADSPSRPGLPLRRLLRQGLIPGAEQRPPTSNGRWFLVRLGTDGSDSGAASSDTTASEVPLLTVVGDLRAEPRRIPTLLRRDAEGLPDKPGLYAWWARPGSLAAFRGPTHPSADLELLYVGIAPSRVTSKATLRSRVLGQHLGGNIGSSTFRQSLAAVLAGSHGWIPQVTGSRASLSPDDNRALTEWQKLNLRLAWSVRERPWEVESDVISTMEPPLNLAGNRSHHMHPVLARLRAELRGGRAIPPATPL